MRVILGEVFDKARCAGVHFGPAKLAVIRFLTRGGLDQRRACEGGEAVFLHADHIVGHARHIGPARSRRTVQDGDHRDARRRQPGEIAEDRAALGPAFDAITG